MIRCPACGFESADDAQWCDFCKEPFRKKPVPSAEVEAPPLQVNPPSDPIVQPTAQAAQPTPPKAAPSQAAPGTTEPIIPIQLVAPAASSGSTQQQANAPVSLNPLEIEQLLRANRLEDTGSNVKIYRFLAVGFLLFWVVAALAVGFFYMARHKGRRSAGSANQPAQPSMNMPPMQPMTNVPPGQPPMNASPDQSTQPPSAPPGQPVPPVNVSPTQTPPPSQPPAPPVPGGD